MTYTFTVMMIQTSVRNHLYFVLQFCGFVGSSGPSQATLLGSSVGSAGTALTTPGDLRGGSRGSSPPYRSISSSPRDVSSLSWFWGTGEAVAFVFSLCGDTARSRYVNEDRVELAIVGGLEDSTSRCDIVREREGMHMRKGTHAFIISSENNLAGESKSVYPSLALLVTNVDHPPQALAAIAEAAFRAS